MDPINAGLSKISSALSGYRKWTAIMEAEQQQCHKLLREERVVSSQCSLDWWKFAESGISGTREHC